MTESLKNISALLFAKLIFRHTNFQNYLASNLYKGVLNKGRCRQCVEKVIDDIERSRMCGVIFRLRSSTLEREFVTKILRVITSASNVFHMLLQFQKVTKLIRKESLLKFLEGLVLKNLPEDSRMFSVNVENTISCRQIVMGGSLNTTETFLFFCISHNFAQSCHSFGFQSFEELTFAEKFRIAVICNAGVVVRGLWSSASEDNKKTLLNEFKEEVAFHLVPMLDLSDVLQWFLDREVSANCKEPLDGNSLLHIAARLGNVRAMSLLIVKGANINAGNNFHETPVHSAAAGGCQEALTFLWNNAAEFEPLCKDGNTPLHIAVDKGHLNVVDLLLKNVAKVNARNKNGCTPLHIAAIRGYVDIINLLIEKGADLDVIDCKRQTPLLKACFRDHSDVEDILLKRWGAKYICVILATVNCTTELHVAAAKGYLKSAAKLLECNADTNAKDEKGKTPLHYACRGGFHEVARLLVHCKNTNVFAVDCNERTAMHDASCYGHRSVVELLLNNRGNPNARDQKGCTPLHYAYSNGHESLVEFLLDREGILCSSNKRGRTILHEAAFNGHLKVVDMILKKHLDKDDIINSVDQNGATAMQLAKDRKHESVVNLLESNGAPRMEVFLESKKSRREIKEYHRDPPGMKEMKRIMDVNAKMEFKESKLHGAVKNRDKDAVQSLLKRKDLKVNLKDANEDTALHLAIENDCPEILEMLIAHKTIDLNAKDVEGNTPLHCAVKKGNMETLHKLFHTNVIKKVKINPKNKKQEIPLHLAARSKDVEVIRLLVRRQVDFNARTSDQKTVMEIAAESGNVQIVQFLREQNVDLDVRNSNGETILHLAINNRRALLTKWILENRPDFVNLRNGSHKTPLLLAASMAKLNVEKIIMCLLEVPDVDLYATLPNGRNALHVFADIPASECSVAYHILQNRLISSKSANMQDQDGFSALHLSASRGNTELVRLLLGCYGIDVNLQNNTGHTALHLACCDGNIDVVTLILNQDNVDIDNEVSEYFSTPLALALNEKRWDIARLLLLKGAKVNVVMDSVGSRPLHYLARENNVDMLEILLKRCNVPKDAVKWLDINAKDSFGFNALHYAELPQIQRMITDHMNE